MTPRLRQHPIGCAQWWRGCHSRARAPLCLWSRVLMRVGSCKGKIGLPALVKIASSRKHMCVVSACTGGLQDIDPYSRQNWEVREARRLLCGKSHRRHGEGRAL